MPLYAYRAIDPQGRRMRGRLPGSSPEAVVRDLEGQGLLALNVEESKEGQNGRGLRFGRRRAVLEFTRAVASLLPAGMPLARALAAGTTAAPDSVRPALESIRSRVERGEELAGALVAHPELFSSLYVGMVRAGEKSGSLGKAFERLTVHLERESELRSKLVSMSIYPVLLGLVGIGAVLVLVLFVLPRFSDLLLSSGAALPATTAAVVGVATAVQEEWWLLAIQPPLVAVFLAWLRTTEGGKRAGARALVHLPLIGLWRRQHLGASFARMVGELLAGGSPLLLALEDARDCMTDSVAQAETDRIRVAVREGSSLHGAIGQGGLFPPVLAQLVALGEDAGRLADFLLKAAELLEKKTERTLERLVALVEPAMIVGFGGIVAVVALALLQAIYGVNAGSF
ncbi:MAG: type II secretion system F family protein [Gemmatimonadota bacterium]|jgi:type II secretory pathway component PulF